MQGGMELLCKGDEEGEEDYLNRLRETFCFERETPPNCTTILDESSAKVFSPSLEAIICENAGTFVWSRCSPQKRRSSCRNREGSKTIRRRIELTLALLTDT